MARKKSSVGPAPSIELSPEKLRTELQRLESTIKKLQEFPVENISSGFDPAIEALEAEIDRRLVNAFGHGTIDYNRYLSATSLTPSLSFGEPPPIQDTREDLAQQIRSSVLLLKQAVSDLRERLSDAESSPLSNTTPTVQEVVENASGSKVFLVHGHSNEMTQSCARVLERLGAQVIILSEQPSEGKTIIEKLELHGDVRYAVVLMTPDDIGKSANDKGDLNPRARQNVVLELGYFIGRLGRERVTALFDPKVEMPSDYHGVVYVPIDAEETWKWKIAKELRSAGLKVDLNKL